MRKTSAAALFAASTVALFAASSAFGQTVSESLDLTVQGPRVASPAKLGSLLIYPGITINPIDDNDTLIEITNNNRFASVNLFCEYVNELKGRVSFSFLLTPNETASWDVKTMDGDQEHPPPFPNYVGWSDLPPGGLLTRGELVCFAVDSNSPTDQISFNYLSGTATPIKVNATSGGALQSKMAYRDNAWAFAAGRFEGDRMDDGDFGGNRQAGTLILDGSRDHYDACPALAQANFMSNGSVLGNLATLQSTIRGVGCYQDLRQDFEVHLTKLQFEIWNSLEEDFGLAYQCVDSVFTAELDNLNPNLNNPQLFDFKTLFTPNAHFQVAGVASPEQCPGSENAAVIGELTSQVTPGGASVVNGNGADEIGSPLYGEGVFGYELGDFISASVDDKLALPGFVLWDPVAQP